MKRALVLLCAAVIGLAGGVLAATDTQLDYIYEGIDTGWYVGADYVYETQTGSFAPYAGYLAVLPTGETTATFDVKITIPDIDDPLAFAFDFGALWNGEALGIGGTFFVELATAIDLSGGWDNIVFQIPQFAVGAVTQVGEYIKLRGEADIAWSSTTLNLTVDRILVGFRIQ